MKNEELNVQPQENSTEDRLYWEIRENKRDIASLDPKDSNTEKIICRLMADRVDYFIELTPVERTERFARMFALDKLQKTDAIGAGKMLFRTYEDGLGLFLREDSAPIDYFDRDLDIPTWLRVHAECRLILDDVMLLFKKINYDLTAFSMPVLNEYIRGILSATTVRVVLSYFDEKQIGYFHFGQSQFELSELLRQALDEELKKSGISVYAYDIHKLEISDEVSAMLRKEYFAVRSQSIRAEAEKRWAELSLEELGRKAELIEKYQLPSDILTEMEKDKAMERYLKKVNNRVDQVKYADHRPDKVELQFSHAEGKKPEEPEMPKNPLNFVIFSCCAIAIFLLLAIFATPVFWVGVLLSVAALIYACVQLNDFGAKKKEYDRLMRVYEHDMELYTMAQNEKEHAEATN